MLNMDKIGRAALSALGALILSTTFVGAAIGPAQAVDAAPVSAAAQVQGELRA